ncbi:hypothetical protein CMO93_04020 [Candidatus Woesearchaeota archaeon]|jgi:V/A-type H+-transporting ATPase subunit E|nr:hypothetical protein [Candidatus Woesearchaeota archaeon]|tara:strand:- start:64 stop:612 length:549 start_codon:yes stop_codon:yes gene_type:complete
MGLEKIKEEILQKAEAAEKGILSEAAAKIDGVKKDVTEKIKQLEQESLQSLHTQMKAIENREQSLQNIESQKMLFEAKKEIMDKVYHEAFNKIKKIAKNEREAIIKKLLEMARKEIDVDVVYANSIDQEFIDANLRVKPFDTDGGIICETKDGSVRVDYTFASLFQDLREKTIKEVSKISFK